MTHGAHKCKVTLKLWGSITEVEKISSGEIDVYKFSTP